MSVVRLYDVVSGVETDTLPVTGTPTDDSDAVTLGWFRQIIESWASPKAIVAGTGLVDLPEAWLITAFIEGSGGNVDVSANPQIEAGTLVGQRLLLVQAGTNAVRWEHGDGLSLNGPFEGLQDMTLELVWTGSLWHEISRRHA